VIARGVAEERQELDYQELFEVARAGALANVNTSAQANVVDDVAQKAVENLLDAQRRGEVIRNPVGFVRHAARCRAIDAMRKWGRDKKRDRPLHDPRQSAYFEEVAFQISHEFSPSARLRQKQESAWADAWLEQTFEAKDREIARLHLEGQKPREIAEALGLKPKTVSNRLVEIRKRCGLR
jgi:RNA polymerase sigma factor (sigma-70 family)